LDSGAIEIMVQEISFPLSTDDGQAASALA
jgi:hypothetical protein